MTTSGPDGLDAALRRLVEAGTLSAEQAAAVRAEVGVDDVGPAHVAPGHAPRPLSGRQPGPEPTLGARLAEVAGYVGGAFVLGATTILLAQEWSDLARPARVTLLTAATLVLAVAGLVVLGGSRAERLATARTSSARQRLSATLFTLAAAAGGAAVGVAADASLSAEHATAVGGLCGAALAVAGYLVCAAPVGQVGVLGGLVTTTLALTVNGGSASVAGAVVTAIGAAWTVLALADLLREPEAGLALGAVVALAGAQVALLGDRHWLAYLLTALVAAGSFAAYLRRSAGALLAVGVLGVTLVVPEAVFDLTGGTVGPAGVLLVAGLALLAASAGGLRIRRGVRDEARPAGSR